MQYTKQQCVELNEGKSTVLIGEVFILRDGSTAKIIKSIDRNLRLVDITGHGRTYRTEIYQGNLMIGSIKNLYRRSVFGIGYIGEGEFEIGDCAKHRNPFYDKWVTLICCSYSNARGVTNEERYLDVSNYQEYCKWIKSYCEENKITNLDDFRIVDLLNLNATERIRFNDLDLVPIDVHEQLKFVWRGFRKPKGLIGFCDCKSGERYEATLTFNQSKEVKVFPYKDYTYDEAFDIAKDFIIKQRVKYFKKSYYKYNSDKYDFKLSNRVLAFLKNAEEFVTKHIEDNLKD